MPSVSKSQQRLMGMAYAVKSGDMKISDIDPAYRDKVKSLSNGMTKKDLKKYASTKHDNLPETVGENTTPANLTGMGPVVLPNNGIVGSGDVPAGSGDAKKRYKKKMKSIKTFEQFVNESYDGEMADFKYEYPMRFEEETGNSPKAIKKMSKKGKGYEVRTSSYMSRQELERVGLSMGLTLKDYKKSNIIIAIYE
jgi:hypothetical protein